MSAEKYRCNVDKKGQKVSSIPRSILLYESIVDTDIDISKVSLIVSISISIFDINNPAADMCMYVCREHLCSRRKPYSLSCHGDAMGMYHCVLVNMAKLRAKHDR